MSRVGVLRGLVAVPWLLGSWLDGNGAVYSLLLQHVPAAYLHSVLVTHVRVCVASS